MFNSFGLLFYYVFSDFIIAESKKQNFPHQYSCIDFSRKLHLKIVCCETERSRKWNNKKKIVGKIVYKHFFTCRPFRMVSNRYTFVNRRRQSSICYIFFFLKKNKNFICDFHNHFFCSTFSLSFLFSFSTKNWILHACVNTFFVSMRAQFESFFGLFFLYCTGVSVTS